MQINHVNITPGSSRASEVNEPETAGSAATSRQNSAVAGSRNAKIGSRRRPLIHLAVALLLVLSGSLLAASPAHAAGYRDLKSVRYNACFYAVGDPLEDLYLKPCTATPAKYGNWKTTLAGYHNNHPLWIIQRQAGPCLGVLGTASSNYLYMSCSPTSSRNVWEVFTTSSGRYVLKSFGAWKSWGQHKCLTFPQAGGSGSVRLGACSLTSTNGQIYR